MAFYHHRLTGAGELGNSVLAGAEKHKLYRKLLENNWLRQDLKNSRFGLGSFIAMRNHLIEINWRVSR